MGLGQGLLGIDKFHLTAKNIDFCGNTYIKLGLGIPQMLSQPVHGFFLEVHRIDAFKDIIISLGRIVARRLVGAIHAIFIIFLVGLGFFYLTFEFPARVDRNGNAHSVRAAVCPHRASSERCTSSRLIPHVPPRGMSKINASPTSCPSRVKSGLSGIQFGRGNLDIRVIFKGHANGLIQIEADRLRCLLGKSGAKRQDTQEDSADQCFFMDMHDVSYPPQILTG